MKKLLCLVKKIHQDEQGAEGLEKLLILGAIVLPLLGLLIYFRNDITEWLRGAASDVRSDSDNYDPTQTGF